MLVDYLNLGNDPQNCDLFVQLMSVIQLSQRFTKRGQWRGNGKLTIIQH